MENSSPNHPIIQSPNLKIIECPRDAMQGLKSFIPTEKKVAYLNQLLKVGFHTLDFGSFVSPKAIPQMCDTAEVVKQLDVKSSSTKLLAIVANERGAQEAAKFEEITYLGYPFSISPTFLKRNINAGIDEAFNRAETLQGICKSNNKTLVVYISMAFGNTYGDHWSTEIVRDWTEKLAGLGVEIISLADTVGAGSPEEIGTVYSLCHQNFPDVEFGLHLHTTLQHWEKKVEAAYSNGCRRFDGVINGLGGCPMAGDELVGNVNTKFLMQFFKKRGEDVPINKELLEEIGSLVF